MAAAAAKRGDVRCAKLAWRDKCKGDLRVDEGFVSVNVCSGAPGVWRQLSPMLLGPVRFEEHFPDGHTEIRTARCFENAWQSAKVHPGEEGPDGFPTPEWYARRARICADTRGHRYVKRGVKPLYAFWRGRKLSYDDARRHVYIPLYARLVRATEAWKRLRAIVCEDGYNVTLVGFDGRAFARLSDELEDLSRPFGHELVLCAMLRGELTDVTESEPWTL